MSSSYGKGLEIDQEKKNQILRQSFTRQLDQERKGESKGSKAREEVIKYFLVNEECYEEDKKLYQEKREELEETDQELIRESHLVENTAYRRLNLNRFLPTIPKGSIAYGIQLGRGGMGAVYQGTYQGKVIAVKKLLRLSAEEIVAFQKEAVIMSNYRHRNLISFLGYCPEEYAFMMEYASGGSLWSLLKSDEAISWEKRYEIGLDVAKGMEYLHDNGVVHCDLKSDNILLDGSRRAKITDFGISALRREHVSSGKSTYGEWGGGTYCWMAPEIFHTNKNTKAGDVYAYGLVLWQLGARKVPFAGIEGLLPYISAGNKEVITTDTPPLIKQVINLCWLPEPPLKKELDTQQRPEMERVRYLLEEGNNAFLRKESREVLNQEKEIEAYQKAAERGDAATQNKLGLMYENGLRAPRDYQEAFEWCQKAAEQGYVPANPDNMSANGQGVKKEELKCQLKLELEGIIKNWPEGERILKQLESKVDTLDLNACNLKSGHISILIKHPHFNQLHTLNLEGNTIGAEGAAFLAKALPNTCIHTLRLNNSQIGTKGISRLIKTLPSTKIYILNLYNNRIGKKGTVKLARILPSIEIHTLNLSLNNVGVAGAQALAKALPSTQIHILDLSSNYIGTEGAIQLAQALPNTQIHTLDLSNNNIGTEGAIQLAQALPSSQIHTLNLESNNIGAEMQKLLEKQLAELQQHIGQVQAGEGKEREKETQESIIDARVVFYGNHESGLVKQAQIGFSNFPLKVQAYMLSFLEQKDFHRASLVCQAWREAAFIAGEGKVLDLSKRKLDKKDCQVLLKVPFCSLILKECQLGSEEIFILSQATIIKHLDLGTNKEIGAAGAQALASGNLSSLTSLNLEGNSIGDSVAQILASGNLSNLTSLNLGYNRIGDAGAKALASGNFASLASLNLEHNIMGHKSNRIEIGATGAQALASGNLANLTSLDLGYNRIGAAGAQALASGNLAALASLNLQSSSIGAAGAEALASGNLSSLTYLNLDSNGIGAAGAKALASGNLSSLTSLDLRGNRIEAAGAKALVNGNLSSLTSLNVGRKGTNKQGKSALIAWKKKKPIKLDL